MKTKVKARKRTVIKWIEAKFGSLAMLAQAAGLDSTQPGVQALLNDVIKSRDPVTLSIGWRSHVIQIDIEHHKGGAAHAVLPLGDVEYIADVLSPPALVETPDIDWDGGADE